ncbi:hypothetical protein BC940DRAFT_344321 [Gongronella butleri]|nr:hypothetical protein BC940DRAFT_344321 [Gongronella butleri]
MPSDKFKISKASRSIRHAAQNFFGTFSISPNGSSQSTSYPIIGGKIPTSIQEDEDTHLDRRSAHNALERQRRETLNSKFQELAHALPALQTVRRPSKTLIVSKSLDYVSTTMQRENSYMAQIKQLRKQNEQLRKQAKAAKMMMLKQQQLLQKRSSPLTPPSSSANTTSTTQSSASSMARTMSTAQTSVTSSLDTVDCPQMSPPLTPETPSKPHHHHAPVSNAGKRQLSPSPAMAAAQANLHPHPKGDKRVKMSHTPQQPQEQHAFYDNAAMMMPPHWSSTTITCPTDLMMSPHAAAAANGYYMNALYSPPMPQQQQPILYAPPHAAENISMMQNTDTINPMLFSPYQWQDGPPTYAKDSNDAYLV